MVLSIARVGPSETTLVQLLELTFSPCTFSTLVLVSPHAGRALNVIKTESVDHTEEITLTVLRANQSYCIYLERV